MLGNILRQEREKQKLTIKEVEQETSIRGLYISAIEEEEYDVLPGEVYLKGFIKTYANFLQLDGAELLKVYYQEKAEKTMPKDEPVAPAAPVAPVAPAAPFTAPDEQPETLVVKVERAKQQQKEDSFSIVKIVAGILLVACIGGAAYWTMNDVEPEVKVAPPNVKAAKKSVQAVPAPVQQNKPAALPEQAKFIEVQAKYTGTCWTKVEADGNVIHEGTSQSGEVLTWKAEQELTITAGNAGAMEIVLAGKPQGKLGNTGEVITKKFLKAGVAEPK